MSGFEQFDLNLYRTFVTVMQTGSYAKASEALGISPPAVSLAMGRLQGILKQELFVRGNAAIQPTGAAQSLFRTIEPQMLILEQSFKSFDHFSPLTSHHVFHLSVPEELQPSLLESLPLDTNEHIQFDLGGQESEEGGVIDTLRHRQIDLAFDSYIFDDRSIEHELLYEDDIVLVAAESHPTVNGKMSYREYEVLPQAALSIRRNNKYALSMVADTANLQRNIAHQGISLISNMLVACRTKLFCHTTRRLANMYKESLKLQVIEPPLELKRLPYYMMWHKSNNHVASHEWLRERIKLSARTW
ncbi:LysR family transcriptional regulator [Vibrio lamellibrachiae]|uniref:LysR family transcriptional regulator n=1 Tax=Vibrio lamellibrachiae TaxID=2910253 RepID=UPI003D0A0AD1